MTRPVLLTLILAVTAGLCPAPAWAGGGGIESGSLVGVRGLLRIVSAANQPAGTLSLGTEAQFYWMPEMLAGPTEGQDHSRLENSLTVAFTPWRYVEAAFSARVASDSSSGGGGADELQVAVGDPRLVIKGGAEVVNGLSLGAMVDLRFLAGAGYFEAAAAATSGLFALLVSWDGGEALPLGVHLNLGFFMEGSKNLVEDPSRLSQAQLHAAGISSFHRVVTRLGLAYDTRYVGPFLEVGMENLVGGDAPGVSEHPTYLSGGLRVWPTRSRSVQILAAVDVGLAGVADGSSLALAPDRYGPVIPRWNLSVGLTYRLGTYAEEPTSQGPGEGGLTSTQPADVSPAGGVIRGTFVGRVLDAANEQPIIGARVAVDGESASPLVVDETDGTFRSYPLQTGKRSLLVKADGYRDHRAQLTILAGRPARVTVRLESVKAATPGTLRGTIKDTSGRVIRQATLLIPRLDRRIKIRRDGSFSTSLEPGEYAVLISAPGFRAQRKRLKISVGATVILNVELHR